MSPIRESLEALGLLKMAFEFPKVRWDPAPSPQDLYNKTYDEVVSNTQIDMFTVRIWKIEILKRKLLIVKSSWWSPHSFFTAWP